MKTALLVILIFSSFTLISAILLSPGKSAGMSGAIAGGAETLIWQEKS